MVLAGPHGCVGRSWTTYLKKYFLASYLKVFIRTHCALQLHQYSRDVLEIQSRRLLHTMPLPHLLPLFVVLTLGD